MAPLLPTPRRLKQVIHKCKLCLYENPYQQCFERHKLHHREKFTYRCHLCSFSERGFGLLDRHVREHHWHPRVLSLFFYFDNYFYGNVNFKINYRRILLHPMLIAAIKLLKRSFILSSNALNASTPLLNQAISRCTERVTLATKSTSAVNAVFLLRTNTSSLFT